MSSTAEGGSWGCHTSKAGCGKWKSTPTLEKRTENDDSVTLVCGIGSVCNVSAHWSGRGAPSADDVPLSPGCPQEDCR